MKEPVPFAASRVIRSILERHPLVDRAVLFGSRAKGNFHEGSDIDLALEGEGLDSREVAVINGELIDSPIPHRVDVLLHQKIRHPELLAHIDRVGRIFYQRHRPSNPPLRAG